MGSADNKKPFHRVALEMIETANGDELLLLARLVRHSVLPDGLEEAVATAFEQRCGELSIDYLNSAKYSHIRHLVFELQGVTGTGAKHSSRIRAMTEMAREDLSDDRPFLNTDGDGESGAAEAIARVGDVLPGLQANANGDYTVKVSASVSAEASDELHGHYDHSHGVPATSEERERTHVGVCPIKGDPNNDHGE